ncbi:jg16512 [Pararge aegeria aegeria]|uniref:Jg16512 protein n=1 Tax=Pararge aegeria aegeria TaxID=348720 RepID=A0A8S4SA20_9NEOP|nr:jg16512 [Pararge aegeria aegeria]
MEPHGTTWTCSSLAEIKSWLHWPHAFLRETSPQYSKCAKFGFSYRVGVIQFGIVKPKSYQYLRIKSEVIYLIEKASSNVTKVAKNILVAQCGEPDVNTQLLEDLLLAVHDIHSILLQHHISKASIFSLPAARSVHASEPYTD